MSVNVYVQEFRKLEVLTVAMRSNIDSVRLCARNRRAVRIFFFFFGRTFDLVSISE